MPNVSNEGNRGKPGWGRKEWTVVAIQGKKWYSICSVSLKEGESNDTKPTFIYAYFLILQ
jgi:hypothetical protein